MSARQNRIEGDRSGEGCLVPGGLLNRWVRMARMPLADRNSKVTQIRAAIASGSYDAESLIDAAIARLTTELSLS